MMNELVEEQNYIDAKKLVSGKTHGTTFDFTVFKDPIKFASVIFHKGSLKNAKDFQNEMFALLNDLEGYNPRK